MTNLQVAWKDTTNEDIAASIIGFVRRMALGAPLISYEERVHRAIKKILASRSWEEPQRKWLDRIGKQLLKEIVVDLKRLKSLRQKLMNCWLKNIIPFLTMGLAKTLLHCRKRR